MEFKKRIKRITGFAIFLVIISFALDGLVFSLIAQYKFSSITKFFIYVTYLGELLSVVFLGVLLSVFLLREKLKIFPLWCSLATVFVFMFFIKLFVMRPRPFEAMGALSIVNTSLSSFPSGHSMALFSLIPFAILIWKKYSYAFWTIGFLVAFSRIYLEVHYLSDVIFGAFLGYIISIIFIRLGDIYGWR